MLPNDYLNLDSQEKAFVIASIQIKQEAEAEQEKKMKRKSKR